jgi:diphosphomevalonate decarboxylase
MKKITARAHSNIALVKYWGKRNIPLNLPAVASVSITLDTLFTDTSVCFDQGIDGDHLILNGQEGNLKETTRVSGFLDRIRREAGINHYALIDSVNNFPTAAGLASSASSFACLALAATKAAGLEWDKNKLSELARLGSGSAARSVFGGFVEMKMGEKKDGSDAVAVPLFNKKHWDLSVLIAITSEQKKKTGSTDGMELSRVTSPYYDGWVDSSTKDINEMRTAIENKDFQKMAEISEFSCLKMHALAIASNPGLIYWNGTTVDLMHNIREQREQGTPVFFTIDAGPQVKAVCLTKDKEKVKNNLLNVKGVKKILETGLGEDVQILKVEECG